MSKRVIIVHGWGHGPENNWFPIASTAIYLDAELATNNRTHFTKIPDLKFFDPKMLK